MDQLANLCGTCLGAGEVFRVHTAVVSGRYQTMQGFIPCPSCGDLDGPVRQRPSNGRSIRPPDR